MIIHTVAKTWEGGWNSVSTNRSLSNWQSYSGKDKNSYTSPIALSDPEKIRFEYNASANNKVVSLDASYIDVKGSKYTGTLTLLPYTSVILMVDPNPSAPPARPVYTSSSIQNSAPSVIEISYDLTLANILPAASSFSVQVNSAVRSINSVGVSGSKVRLTLSSPVVFGDVVLLSYTVPSTNPLQTPAGGKAESISDRSVTNLVNAVSPPPVVPPPVVPPPVVPPPPDVPNVPPVVKLKYMTENFSGFTGTLNASDSYDANNDNLIYSWKIPGHISVSSTNGPVIEYLAPVVDINQTLEFELSVTDGITEQSESFQVKIIPYQPGLEKAEVISVQAGDFQSPNNPYNILDGNIGTMWAANGIEQWIILELNGFFNIQHFKLAFQPGQKRESYFEVSVQTTNKHGNLSSPSQNHVLFQAICRYLNFRLPKTEKEFKYIKLVGQGNMISWNYISEFRYFRIQAQKSPRIRRPDSKNISKSGQGIVNVLIDEQTFIPDFIKIVTLAGKTIYDNKIDPW